MTVVVDASVVVAGLASADATGKWAETVLAGEPLAAPHLMPVEAASILHRAELAGEISADTASLAHADLRRLRVEYFPYDPFAERIWELRSPGLAEPPGSPEPARLLFPPGPASSARYQARPRTRSALRLLPAAAPAGLALQREPASATTTIPEPATSGDPGTGLPRGPRCAAPAPCAGLEADGLPWA